MNNKGKVDNIFTVLIVFVLAMVLVTAIDLLLKPNLFTKSLGGETTIVLEPGLKLEEITWKDDSLWYLTREMRDGEKAEIHVFQQSSSLGILEGTVTIIEQDLEDAGWE